MTEIWIAIGINEHPVHGFEILGVRYDYDEAMDLVVDTQWEKPYVKRMEVE